MNIEKIKKQIEKQQEKKKDKKDKKLKNSAVVVSRSGIDTIATGLVNPSSNTKTGDVLQVKHVANEQSPTQTIKSKKDDIVCGDCPLKGKVCYVNPISLNASWKSTRGQAPLGEFPKVNKSVRFGEYGETVLALDFDFFKAWVGWIKSQGLRHFGYTHQWKKAKTNKVPWNKYLMASIDDISAKNAGTTSAKLKDFANSLGWRTFRVIKDLSELLPDEILCVNTTHGVTCDDCGLCNGKKSPNDRRKNIAALAHGPINKIKTYLKA